MLHRIKVILNKIAHAPASQSGDALAQLIALGQLRGIRPLIEQEYEAMPIVVSVEDSKILRPPIDRAHARGMAEGHSRGRVEGKVEGKAEGKAEAIATILSQRFPGQVPADLSDRLSLVASGTLDEILRRSLTATSVADA